MFSSDKWRNKSEVEKIPESRQFFFHIKFSNKWKIHWIDSKNILSDELGSCECFLWRLYGSIKTIKFNKNYVIPESHIWTVTFITRKAHKVMKMQHGTIILNMANQAVFVFFVATQSIDKWASNSFRSRAFSLAKLFICLFAFCVFFA